MRDMIQGGVDLLGAINLEEVQCLNEDEDGMGRSILKPRSEMLSREPALSSPYGDPELLMCVPFLSPVKIHTINIIGGGEGTTPSKVRCFINLPNLDFDDARSMTATQEFDLVDNFTGELEWPVRVSKFTNVTLLWLFFPDCSGDDHTVITYIGFKGENSNLKREAVTTVYEKNPQLADHKSPGEEFGRQDII